MERKKRFQYTVLLILLALGLAIAACGKQEEAPKKGDTECIRLSLFLRCKFLETASMGDKKRQYHRKDFRKDRSCH